MAQGKSQPGRGEEARAAVLLVARLPTHREHEGCSQLLYLKRPYCFPAESGESFGEGKAIFNTAMRGAFHEEKM